MVQHSFESGQEKALLRIVMCCVTVLFCSEDITSSIHLFVSVDVDLRKQKRCHLIVERMLAFLVFFLRITIPFCFLKSQEPRQFQK
jgi:hypothetical protein